MRSLTLSTRAMCRRNIAQVGEGRHGGWAVGCPRRRRRLHQVASAAGLATGPGIAGGIFPFVEGNTWANSDFAHCREGVYALQKEAVTQCKFFRFA